MPSRKGSPNKNSTARTGNRNKTGRLTPHDRKKTETVDCPNRGRSGHGLSCSLCGGSGKIQATR